MSRSEIQVDSLSTRCGRVQFLNRFKTYYTHYGTYVCAIIKIKQTSAVRSRISLYALCIFRRIPRSYCCFFNYMVMTYLAYTTFRRVETKERGTGFAQRLPIKVVPNGHSSRSSNSYLSRSCRRSSTMVVSNGHPLRLCPTVLNQGRAIRPSNRVVRTNCRPSGSYESDCRFLQARRASDP